ncbi:MAG TPA: YkvA family protein [Gammaproteobacteria bacterium]|nr:YkvA family protein [Gammaproteobacteria bacterium]
MLEKLKAWARAVKRDVLAVYLAIHDPRVPWYAKVLAAITAAYALSPIDLIPDFIPVLGYVDDVILLPLLIFLTLRLIPRDVMVELRAKAQNQLISKRFISKAGAAAIILLWLITAGLVAFYLIR